MATQDVRFIIAVEDAGAIRKLTETERALYDLQNTSKKTGASMSVFASEWKRLTASFVSGQIIVDGMRKAFGILKGEISAVINEAIEAEKVDRALEAALTITGQAAGGAANHFKNYASALQRKTVYDDEAIKSAQTLMIQMGLSTGVIDKATRGAIGLSAVFGQDLASSARDVALGFQGNYRAIGMLIPAVRQATTEGEKQAAMMKALGEYYQRAESDVNTFAGRLAQIKNAYNELRETAGELVINNKAVLTSLEGIKSIIEWLDMQAKKGAAGGDKKSILDYFGPKAVWNGLTAAISGAGGAAKKAVDDYAKSWEGFTAGFLKLRGGVLEPIPILINNQTTAWQKLVAQVLEARRAYKLLEPTAFTLLETELPPPKTNPYQSWLDAQYDFAKEATKEVKDFYENSHDYSAEFYQDITRGFTKAFMAFGLSVEGFKNFFIETWQAIKQAFFQILADMLARWVAMSFVSGITSLLFPGSFFGGGSAGSIGFAKGFEGVISQPTPILVGEAGPEYVSVRPMGKPGGGGGNTYNINWTVHAIDAEGVEKFLRHDAYPTLKAMFAHGEL